MRVSWVIQFSRVEAFTALTFHVRVLCCLSVGDNGPSVLGPHFLLSNFVSSFLMFDAVDDKS
jgi:hypothetical protein